MQLNLSSSSLAKYTIEIKYIGFVMLLLLGIYGLNWLNVLVVFDDGLRAVLHLTAILGVPGMLILAFFANATPLIQIPYTFPIITAALGGSSLEAILVLGAAAGIGAGFAKFIAYTIADKLLATQPSLVQTRLFRFIQHTVTTYPKRIPILIFCMTALPLPDDAVIIPLALVRYGRRRFFWPAFCGKVVHNIGVAFALYCFTDLTAQHISSDARSVVALGLLAAVVTVILYQVEKVKHITKQSAR